MIMTFTADEKEILKKKLYIRYLMLTSGLVIKSEKYLILGEMYSYQYLPYIASYIECIYLVVNSLSLFSHSYSSLKRLLLLLCFECKHKIHTQAEHTLSFKFQKLTSQAFNVWCKIKVINFSS